MRKLSDPVREAVGLPLGPSGCYFVGGGDPFGQGRDSSIVDYNNPPGHLGYGSTGGILATRWEENQKRTMSGVSQPGLWCKWIPNEDGTAIVWSGAEKFYDYIAWLQYLVDHFLGPWGYILNGVMDWQGEETNDNGTIFVENNVIWTSKTAKPEFDEGRDIVMEFFKDRGFDVIPISTNGIMIRRLVIAVVQDQECRYFYGGHGAGSWSQIYNLCDPESLDTMLEHMSFDR
jgi:hypothetical protein